MIGFIAIPDRSLVPLQESIFLQRKPAFQGKNKIFYSFEQISYQKVMNA